MYGRKPLAMPRIIPMWAEKSGVGSVTSRSSTRRATEPRTVSSISCSSS